MRTPPNTTYEALYRLDCARKLTYALELMTCAIDEDDERTAFFHVIHDCAEHLKEAVSLLEAVHVATERKSA